MRLTGPAPLRVLGAADNGVKDGRYRGAIVLRRDAAQVLVVDDAGLEDYLLGVVPAEMPASWPAEALRSQAVVARSYALTSRSPVEPFDVFADTRSQVYRGVDAESPRSTDAVRATGGIVLMFGTTVARTLFHSSSGGRTASADEVFGGAPVPYLRLGRGPARPRVALPRLDGDAERRGRRPWDCAPCSRATCSTFRSSRGRRAAARRPCG